MGGHGFSKQVGKWFYCKCGLRFPSMHALNEHIRYYQDQAKAEVEDQIQESRASAIQELKLVEVSRLEDLERLEPGTLVSIPVELLKPHPKAIAIPMSEEDEKALKESIREKGVLDPIHINPRGVILDGVHRWKYAGELGIKKVPAKLFKYQYEEEEILHALEINLRRRQLTESQKATLALDMLKVEEELAKKRKLAKLRQYSEADQMNKDVPPLASADANGCTKMSTQGKATTITAKKLGIGSKTLERVKKAIEIDPSLKEPLLRGEISAREAYRRAKEKARREEKARELEEAKRDVRVDLRLGDFRELIKEVPDNSIDLVLTDPPYGKEFLETWPILAEECARVLKPGRFMITLSGQMFLPRVIEALSRHLEYYWCAWLVFRHQDIRIWDKRVWNSGKPILVFRKPGPKYDHEWLHDLVKDSGPEKDLDNMQQSVESAKTLIEAFTKPGETVLDPVAGTGTTLEAAILAGRNALGFEKDSETFLKARRRLHLDEI